MTHEEAERLSNLIAEALSEQGNGVVKVIFDDWHEGLGWVDDCMHVGADLNFWARTADLGAEDWPTDTLFEHIRNGLMLIELFCDPVETLRFYSNWPRRDVTASPRGCVMAHIALRQLREGSMA